MERSLLPLYPTASIYVRLDIYLRFCLKEVLQLKKKKFENQNQIHLNHLIVGMKKKVQILITNVLDNCISN